MDLEIGCLLTNEQVKPLMIADGVRLTVRELPAVEQMATSIHRGLEDHPITYNALGRWLEQHHYRIVGPGRELLLENYYPAEPEKCIVEIQFPVERINGAEFDLSVTTSYGKLRAPECHDRRVEKQRLFRHHG